MSCLSVPVWQATHVAFIASRSAAVRLSLAAGQAKPSSAAVKTRFAPAAGWVEGEVVDWLAPDEPEPPRRASGTQDAVTIRASVSATIRTATGRDAGRTMLWKTSCVAAGPRRERERLSERNRRQNVKVVPRNVEYSVSDPYSALKPFPG